MNAAGISLAALAAMVMIGGCATTPGRAPVIDRLPSSQSTAPSKKPAAKPKEPDWRPATYTVQKGDTLYSIALEHGQEYKEIAEWNGIPAPYSIRIGQVLRLSSLPTEITTPFKSLPSSEAKPLPSTEPSLKTEPKASKQPYSDHALALLEKPMAKPVPVVPPKPEIAKSEPPKPIRAPDPIKPDASGGEEDSLDWGWPASGKILTNFNDNGSSKGVDIGGNIGQAVNAAASGKVVHTGSTLRGYGKLVIIKHNKSYFSVYAHNNLVLVQEGQGVVKGQKIAEMGSSDADRVKLHFEIRHLGKPADPLKFLPNDRTYELRPERP
ncbi:MAG: peptidoglycan DD-metalloendopeptidase family protein [Hydrogenophilales bacterium]|nr:peptidoglycan DD-metalloendopeptidase family protein [Hydrogenophilales bacterium]